MVNVVLLLWSLLSSAYSAADRLLGEVIVLSPATRRFRAARFC